MTKPREKTREELTAEIEDGKKKIRQFENREKVLRQKLSIVNNSTHFDISKSTLTLCRSSLTLSLSSICARPSRSLTSVTFAAPLFLPM